MEKGQFRFAGLAGAALIALTGACAAPLDSSFAETDFERDGDTLRTTGRIAFESARGERDGSRADIETDAVIEIRQVRRAVRLLNPGQEEYETVTRRELAARVLLGDEDTGLDLQADNFRRWRSGYSSIEADRPGRLRAPEGRRDRRQAVADRLPEVMRGCVVDNRVAVDTRLSRLDDLPAVDQALALRTDPETRRLDPETEEEVFGGRIGDDSRLGTINLDDTGLVDLTIRLRCGSGEFWAYVRGGVR